MSRPYLTLWNLMSLLLLLLLPIMLLLLLLPIMPLLLPLPIMLSHGVWGEVDAHHAVTWGRVGCGVGWAWRPLRAVWPPAPGWGVRGV